MRLWVGKEMEGEYKGTYTLFVGHPNIGFEEIKKAISDRPTVCQIYFGAGGCTKINQEVVRDCRRWYKTFLITMEVSIKQLDKYDFSLLRNVNLIVTFNQKNVYLIGKMIPHKVQIKLQTEKPDENRFLALTDFNAFDDTNVDKLLGKKYVGDIVIK